MKTLFKWRNACVLAALLLLVAFRGPADGFLQQLRQQLARFYLTTFPEKAYLHLDKPVYAAGETVWLKAYVVEAGNHRPDTLSQVLYVDLLTPDQVLVRQQLLRITADGTTIGNVLLPDTLAQGRYTVRAYTNWMRNTGPDSFFSQQITVWPTPIPIEGATLSQRRPRPADKPGARLTVQFFPEGGHLVAGLESTVGFKAVAANGRGVEVEGTIKDGRGQPVAAFRSQHLGMGRFQFTPQPGQTYLATVREPGGAVLTLPLPAALPAGFTIKVAEMPDNFKVYIQRQAGAGEAPAEAMDAGGPRARAAGLRRPGASRRGRDVCGHHPQKPLSGRRGALHAV